METAGETDAVDAVRSSKNRNKKLSRTKLKKAKNACQAWYQRLDKLQDREDCTGKKLTQEIKDYCISTVKKKQQKRIV